MPMTTAKIIKLVFSSREQLLQAFRKFPERFFFLDVKEGSYALFMRRPAPAGKL